MKNIIRFTKKNGEIPSIESVFSRLENVFKTIPNGDYTLYPEKAQKHRSIRQSKLMWLWFTCIENETGQNKQDIHDYYCMLYLRRTAMINDNEVVIVSGTSKLNTEQFTDFLNKIQADAASEFGIKLPNPEDLHFKEFEDYYKNYL